MSLSSDYALVDEYADVFRQNFGFKSEDDLNESHDINDINVKIADMMIRRGYFRTSSSSSPSLVYDFATSQYPDFISNCCNTDVPKFVVSDDTMADLNSYGSYQPLWDFIFARESCVRANPVAFEPPTPYIGFIFRKDEESTYPLDIVTVDDQSYYIDGMAGYDTPEDYDCETIAAGLTNRCIHTPIWYDGDYRKIIEYNIDFPDKETRKEYINMIMDTVGSAVSTLAYRRPSANPYEIETFQWLLRYTFRGNLMQMPVLPEIKSGDE